MFINTFDFARVMLSLEPIYNCEKGTKSVMLPAS